MSSEIINPGNILPFYKNVLSQMKNRAGCKEFNWAIPVNQGESLSFQLPIEQAALESLDWFLLDENGVDIVALDSPYLLYSEDQDGNGWVTYKGDIPYLNELGCGVYSIKIVGRGEIVLGYSEQFRVMPIGQIEKAYRLDFSHGTNIDGIIYEFGYEQTVWLLDAVYDTPEVVEETENATDGDSVEVLVFQSVQRREVLRFPYFPDYWQGVFHRLRMLENVTLTKLQTSEDFDLENTGLLFASEDQDVCFKKGILSWIGSTQVFGGCEENGTWAIIDNVLQ